MTHTISKTSDYGTYKQGAYEIGGKFYRTTGIKTGNVCNWTLVLDNTTHPSLRALKAHLLRKLAQ